MGDKRSQTSKSNRKLQSDTVAESVAPSMSTRDRLKKYNQVVDKAELIAIQLLAVKFDSDINYSWEKEPKSKLKYDVIIDDTIIDLETGKAAIFVICNVDSKVGRKKVISCKTKYAVAYSGLSDCEEGAIKAFLARVGRFACYPYFRSLFATMDWNAQTRMPPLPVLKEPPRRPSKPELVEEDQKSQLSGSPEST